MLLMAHHSNVKANPTEVLPKFQLQNKTFFNTPSWIPTWFHLCDNYYKTKLKTEFYFLPFLSREGIIFYLQYSRVTDENHAAINIFARSDKIVCYSHVKFTY